MKKAICLKTPSAGVFWAHFVDSDCAKSAFPLLHCRVNQMAGREIVRPLNPQLFEPSDFDAYGEPNASIWESFDEPILYLNDDDGVQIVADYLHDAPVHWEFLGIAETESLPGDSTLPSDVFRGEKDVFKTARWQTFQKAINEHYLVYLRGLPEWINFKNAIGVAFESYLRGVAPTFKSKKANFQCPFHAEKNGASAFFYDDSHTDHSGAANVYCRGKCQKSFDFLDAVRILEGLSFADAVEFCAQFAGVENPLGRGFIQSVQKIEGLSFWQAADFCAEFAGVNA